MAWGPYSTDLPLSGSPATRRVRLADWDSMMDNFPNWKADVNGGGHILSNVIIIPGSTGFTGSGTLDFPEIPDGGSAELTFTVTGALTGHQLIAGWPSTLEAGLIGFMFVSAPNTVKVRLMNASGADLNPAGGQTFSARVGVGAAPNSAALTFPAIPDLGVAALTYTVAGAAIGDRVVPSWPSTLEAGLIGFMRVSAADTIEVRLLNASGADLTPAAAQNFGVTLL